MITDDVLTAKMAGPAIRAWHIAEALAAHQDVVLATTSELCEVASPHFTVESAGPSRFAELERWCDVAIVQGYLLHNVPSFRGSKKVMVFDLYDPLHLEALVLSTSDPEPDRSINVANTVGTLEEQLVRGDYFVCASERQRDLWLGFLAALGRVNPHTYEDDPTLRRLIDVVAFGLPDEPPQRTAGALRGVVPGIGPGDDVVIWGGGLYDWFDPLTLIRAVDKVRVTRPRVRLYFLGTRHPKPDIEESGAAVEARRLSDALGLTDVHVFFNDGWVDYAERQNFLMEADVGVSLHLENLETMYSFRTRILDYLWTGLPIVATAGDGFADIISAEGLGVVVPGQDVDAVAHALVGLLSDRHRREECRARSVAVAARFRWSVVLEPLVAFCGAPRRAPDQPGWPGEGRSSGPAAASTAPAPGLPGQRLGRVATLYRQGGGRAVAGGVGRKIRALLHVR
ncbi:MAG TPA: glycosyltransferase [Acidimicrobiales bacterium]|nr:glycosyltransferase [Acidimicrobiales bacterium]